MDWRETIAVGIKMIIEGCDKAGLRGCKDCPFGPICDIIVRDDENCYSTPDCWEEEGIFKKPIDIL